MATLPTPLVLWWFSPSTGFLWFRPPPLPLVVGVRLPPLSTVGGCSGPHLFSPLALSGLAPTLLWWGRGEKRSGSGPTPSVVDTWIRPRLFSSEGQVDQAPQLAVVGLVYLPSPARLVIGSAFFFSTGIVWSGVYPWVFPRLVILRLFLFIFWNLLFAGFLQRSCFGGGFSRWVFVFDGSFSTGIFSMGNVVDAILYIRLFAFFQTRFFLIVFSQRVFFFLFF